MAKKPNHKLPFDSRGGVCVVSRHLLESAGYLGLSAQAKVLMLLMHQHWRNDHPVGYGIREACEKIPCAKATAMAVFNELEHAGFVVMVEESLFNSRTQSKSRTWRLTWLPYRDKYPTNDWEKLQQPGQK